VLMVIVLIWIIKYMIRENKADQIAGLDHLAEGI
jgi:flagellar biogenesis protein FliO